eukprot:403372716
MFKVERTNRLGKNPSQSQLKNSKATNQSSIYNIEPHQSSTAQSTNQTQNQENLKNSVNLNSKLTVNQPLNQLQFQSPRAIGITLKNHPLQSSTKTSANPLQTDSNRQSLRKSPTAVINKYYKNFGQSQMTSMQQRQENGGKNKLGSLISTVAINGISKVQEIKKGRKDLTITFQKERSGDHTLESNHKPVDTQGTDTQNSNSKNIEGLLAQNIQSPSNGIQKPNQIFPSINVTSNQITMANSLQGSFNHHRTQSWQILPQQVNTLNQGATTSTMFGDPTSRINDQSYSSNKIAAMTCILKGLQHLNQSEYCQNMKKQVLDRKASQPQFTKNLLEEFDKHQEITQQFIRDEEHKQDLLGDDMMNEQGDHYNYQGRLETAPHFFNPDNETNTPIDLSLIDLEKRNAGDSHEQSFFNCPEVSPVKTAKQSFANQDQSQSILDQLCPQKIGTSSNQYFQQQFQDQQSVNVFQQANIVYRQNQQQHSRNDNQSLGTSNQTGGSRIPAQTFTCTSSPNVSNQTSFAQNSYQPSYDIKDFKEQYVKFGLWPEMNFNQQKQLKKKAVQLQQQNKLQKNQIDQLKKANISLQHSLSQMQLRTVNQIQNEPLAKNQCLRRETCFSNKKQNNRYVPCNNCSSNYSQFGVLSQNKINGGISQLSNNHGTNSFHQRSRSQDMQFSPKFQNSQGEIIQTIQKNERSNTPENLYNQIQQQQYQVEQNGISYSNIQGQNRETIWNQRNHSITLDEIKEAIKLIALANSQNKNQNNFQSLVINSASPISVGQGMGTTNIRNSNLGLSSVYQKGDGSISSILIK